MKLLPEKKTVIYGVTDRRKDPWYEKLNDFLIDKSPVATKTKSIFFHSLHLLVASGVSFTKALEMLSARQKNQRFRRILDTIVYDMVKNGKSFSGALEKHPDVFSRPEIKVIYAGEISGTIEKNLSALAQQISKNLEIQMRVKTALMYPVTVLSAVAIAVVVVMIWVVPRFTDLFAQFPSSQLPLSTRTLIGFSDFVQGYWWFLALLIVGAGGLFTNWRKTNHGEREWDGFLLSFPWIGKIISDIQTVQIANNFSTLLKAGIPVERVLKILSNIVSNTVVGDDLARIGQKIIKGIPLFESFSQAPSIDPTLAEVIEVGEQGGNIPEILEKTAQQYQLEVDTQLKNLNTMIEPAIIILMGAMVVFMALAILTPILQLQEMFSHVT